MDPILIGKFINEERIKNNLTQKELASKLSVTSQAISKWENGRGIPDIEMLKKLSELFQVDMENILEGKKRKSNKKYKYIILSLVLFLIVVGGIIILLNYKTDTFNFYTIATDNDAFSIKGVVAFDKNKKSIYISDVLYNANDESKYKAI